MRSLPVLLLVAILVSRSHQDDYSYMAVYRLDSANNITITIVEDYTVNQEPIEMFLYADIAAPSTRMQVTVRGQTLGAEGLLVTMSEGEELKVVIAEPNGLTPFSIIAGSDTQLVYEGCAQSHRGDPQMCHRGCRFRNPDNSFSVFCLCNNMNYQECQLVNDCPSDNLLLHCNPPPLDGNFSLLYKSDIQLPFVISFDARFDLQAQAYNVLVRIGLDTIQLACNYLDVSVLINNSPIDCTQQDLSIYVFENRAMSIEIVDGGIGVQTTTTLLVALNSFLELTVTYDQCLMFILNEDHNQCRGTSLTGLYDVNFCVCNPFKLNCPNEQLNKCDSTSSRTSTTTSPTTTTNASTSTTTSITTSTSISSSTSSSTLTSTSTSTSTLPSTSTSSSTSTSTSTTTSTSLSTSTSFSTSTLTSTSSSTSTSTSPPTSSSTSPSSSTSITTTDERWTTSTSDPPLPVDDNSGILKNISDSGVGLNNVTLILNTTLHINKQLGSDKNGSDLYYISQIIYKSSNLEGINLTDATLVLRNIDAMLDAPLNQFRRTTFNGDAVTQRVLSTLPLIVLNTRTQEDISHLDGNHFGFTAQANKCGDESSGSHGLAFQGNKYIVFSDPASASDKHSIVIPRETLCGSDVSHSMLTIFNTPKLHVSAVPHRTLDHPQQWLGNFIRSALRLDSEVTAVPDGTPDACLSQSSLLADVPVFGATIFDIDNVTKARRIVILAEGQTMAAINIDMTKKVRPLHGTLAVTWWDEEELEWAKRDQCSLTQTGTAIQADCPHLTDFTLIVDGMVNDPAVCDVPLVALGYTLSALSILSLLVIVFIAVLNKFHGICRLTFLAFLIDNAFHVQTNPIDHLYSCVLLFFYLSFTIFSDSGISGGACGVFAAVSYSLLLSSGLLTLFQSHRTLSHLAPHPLIRACLHFSSRQLFVVTMSLVPPFLISLILSLISDFFKRDDGYCWVRPDYISFAVVVPLSILVVNGVFCTSLVIWRLLQEQGEQLVRGTKHVRRRVITIILMQFTLGMPWALQYFSIFSSGANIWHYLFTVFNASQGVILLLLHFYRRERVINSMRRNLKDRNAAIRQKHKEEDDEITK